MSNKYSHVVNGSSGTVAFSLEDREVYGTTREARLVGATVIAAHAPDDIKGQHSRVRFGLSTGELVKLRDYLTDLIDRIESQPKEEGEGT